MSAMAPANPRRKRSKRPRQSHIHLPSVHLRNGDDGFDYEEDLYVDRERIERTVLLVAIEDGRTRFERLTRDVLSAEEEAWFDQFLPVLMEEGNPEADEIMKGRARLEYLRQCRIARGEEKACFACGCSETRTCSGGCIWANPNICSRCVS